MTASALFSVASTSYPAPSTAVQPYAVNYGDTITLQIVNMAGLEPIASVIGISYAGQPLPVITYRGRGRFTFPMPSDPGDTFGRSFLVEIVGNAGLDEFGRPNSKLICRRVIGVPDADGVVPICGNETGDDTDPTGLIGWIARLARGGGGGSGNFLPLSGSQAMRGTLDLGGHGAVGATDAILDSGLVTLRQLNAALSSVSPNLSTHIGIATVTLGVNGTGTASGLPADFDFVPSPPVNDNGGPRGRMTWTKSGTMLVGNSTDPNDISTFKILWYSASGGSTPPTNYVVDSFGNTVTDSFGAPVWIS